MSEHAIVIGGGASGMYVSALLGKRGFHVVLLEQNEKLGKKLFITGKGRGNLTNDCERDVFFQSVVSNPKFLYSAYQRFGAKDTIRWFTEHGLSLKTERGRRVFPKSDHAYEITDVLKKELRKHGVDVRLETRATCIRPLPDGRWDVKTDKGCFQAERLILATGGLSYPSTGATGDGFRFAEDLGLKVTERNPSLVGYDCEGEVCKRLAGLSLRNITFTIRKDGKRLFREFGELLFTHTGISGPLVLTASSVVNRKAEGAEAFLDLKPAIPDDELEERISKLLAEGRTKKIGNAVRPLFPSSMVSEILSAAKIPDARVAGEITKGERKRLFATIRAFPLTITSLRGYSEAVITKGGIDVKEIDPATMEVKKFPGLYAIGEVLDLDALTGGFNLQIAWTTAYAAATAEKKEAI